jgi:hypothetical protein
VATRDRQRNRTIRQRLRHAPYSPSPPTPNSRTLPPPPEPRVSSP